MRPLGTTGRVVFLDLDDTLFHSRHKAPEAGSEVARLEVAALAADGAPSGFMSRRQRIFFDWIAAGAEIVATTGRSAVAFRRVTLPLDGWAICSFGGLILRPDGTSDPRWRATVAPLANAHAAALVVLAEVARAESIRVRVVEDDGLPLYVSVKSDVGDEARLAPIAARLRAAAPDWSLHTHGHNLALMPGYLGKEHAVRWMRAHVVQADAVAIGVGDSVSDGPFLAACDYAIAPSRSALFARWCRVAPDPGGST